MKDMVNKLGVSSGKQALLIGVILVVGVLLGAYILTTEAAGPAADAHGHGVGHADHAEAAGHMDEERHAEPGAGEHGHADEHADEQAGREDAHDHAEGHADEGDPHHEGEVELSDGQIHAAGITLATAQPASIRSGISLPGEIAFNADRTARVVPRLAGVVEQVQADLGQQVKKGEVLAVIASMELSEHRSSLATAQKRLELARTTYAREKQLWEEGISAKQDYLAAEQVLREAELSVANAREQLQALGTDGGERGALSRYEIRAPFDGMIVEKDITLGETVGADAAVFTLSDLSSVWADVIVPAKDLDKVQVGSQAIIEATAFESRAEGTVSYVGSLVGQQNRSAMARITLTNPGGVWRPGLFVNVQVLQGEERVPVAVRPGAVHTVEQQPVVFVRTEHGFVAAPVVTGRQDAKAVEITRGLESGARYALDNSFVIKSELGKGAAEHNH